MDQVLDGKTAVKPVPFDAHDRVLRDSPVVHKAAGVDETPEPVNEYPKAIAHDKETGEPLVARDADHEVELLEKLEAKEK